MLFAHQTAGKNSRRVHTGLEWDKLFLVFDGRVDLVVTEIATSENWQYIIDRLVDHVDELVKHFKEDPEDYEVYVKVEDALRYCRYLKVKEA